MRETENGFLLAFAGLEKRVPGEALGPRQAVIANQLIADLR